MKAFLIAAAAGLGIAMAAPASAQMTTHTTTTTVKQTSVERHGNGNWHRPHWVKRKVCRTVWRHHRKVRQCTWKRVRVR